MSVLAHQKTPITDIKKEHPVRRIIFRGFIALLTLLLCVLLFLFGIITVLCKGPSPTIRDLFVTTVMETSAAKFLAHIYFSDAEIEAIQEKNAVITVTDVTEVTDTGDNTDFTETDDSLPKDTIELKDVSGLTFKGKMLIVHDPSRVSVAAAPIFNDEAYGKRVEEFVAEANAVAGINGGGFEDENGTGRGASPIGLVIANSEILNGNPQTKSPIVGFDKNNKLIVGTMTGEQCLKLGVRDALSFGPTFIVNGKAAAVSGTGGGLNPRTVLGQRADGAVLLLTIDGRQASSMGASYKDCIDVMLDFGAINAGNLDGGSSSIMVYNGEFINNCSSLYGSRKIPTAFIVK